MFIENKYVSGKLEKWVVGVGWGVVVIPYHERL
jgi:hypothetical protein